LTQILEQRRCVRCGSDKTYIDKNGHPYWRYDKDKLICDSCYGRQWCVKNREHRIEYSRQWYIKNREHSIELVRRWRLKNREHRIEYSRQWHERHPTYRKVYNIIYQPRNTQLRRIRRALKRGWGRID